MKFDVIENFVEYSSNVKRIVFLRGTNPSWLTKTMLLSLINACLRNKQNEETILLYLDHTIQITDEVMRVNEENANVIKLLRFGKK